MVEFTDPNPFKEFHIGHLYSNTVGESVSRMFEALGANVKRANYQGDVGMHVAKAIYSILEFNIKEFEELEKKIQEDLQDTRLPADLEDINIRFVVSYVRNTLPGGMISAGEQKDVNDYTLIHQSLITLLP